MNCVDATVVGAGPYGLSIAANLVARGIKLRAFGPPMQTWREHMPEGMMLKSDGFASNLSEATKNFSLADYCAGQKIPYHDWQIPVALSSFVGYGLDFQRRFVPFLDARMVIKIKKENGSFSVALADGETVATKRIILATGISDFSYLPDMLAKAGPQYVTHSSAHKDPREFHGKDVAIVGAGASAIDLAVTLREAGARPSLVFRAPALKFGSKPLARKPNLWHDLRNPKSGLGPGVRSRLFCDYPHLFRLLPPAAKQALMKGHLGPAAAWYQRAKIDGLVPQFPGSTIVGVEPAGGKVALHLTDSQGARRKLLFDHIVAATGYRANLDRMGFVDASLRGAMKRTPDNMPVLSGNFESSVPGVYFAGIAAVGSFGPLMRFVYGASFAADRIAGDIASGRRNSEP